MEKSAILIALGALCHISAGQTLEFSPGATRPSNLPGADSLGTVRVGPIDIENRVPGGASSVLGVEEAWGHLWFSARNNDGAGGGPVFGRPHKIFKFTLSGEYLATFEQATGWEQTITPTTSPWGARDLAADEAANRLYYGWESGYFAWHTYDPVTGGLSAPTTTRITGYTNTIRALALRGDNGRFIGADFFNPVREFSITEGLVASYANTFRAGGGASAIAGLAYADINGPKLWLWSQDGPFAWHEGYAIELSLSGANPVRTGREFLGAMVGTGPANTAGGAGVVCRDGRVLLAAIHQTQPDSLLMYDLDDVCSGGCPCACDFDVSTGPGVCDIFDFLAFGNRFSAAEACACDIDISTGPGVCDIFDFLGFGNGFTMGCP